jgi:hypothetical protein
MSSSLTRLQVGVVGVEPGIVFLVTSATEAEIFAPGFINQIEQSTDVNVQKGDFIFVKYEDGTLQEMCIPDVATNGVITLLPVAGDFNSGGPIDGGQNVGGGEEVFKDILADLMRFRTLVAGANITLTTGTDIITIDAVNPGVGTITDGFNLGSGTGVFAQASGADLQFKTLIAGANINLTPTGNDITIDATSAAGGTITDGLNLGTGNGVFESAVGSDLRFKGLKSGANVTIVPDGDSLTISASTLGGGDISNGINIGGGSEVFKEVVAPSMVFRTLLAGSNVTITENANDITIASTGGGGGGNFDYVNTWYVASNGNDSNSGKNINEPKLTLAGAKAAFTGLNNVIIIEDNGTYPSFFVEEVAGAVTQIKAPNATFTGTIGPVFGAGSVLALTAPTLIVDCYQIIGNGAQPPLITYSGNPSALIINCIILNGNTQDSYIAITGNQIAGAFITADVIVGGMEFGSVAVVTAKNMLGNILHSTGLYIGRLIANFDSFTGTIGGDGDAFGYFGSTNPSIPSKFYVPNLSLNDKAIINEIYDVIVTSVTINVTADDSNKLIIGDVDFPNLAIRLPDWAATPDLPIGFRVWVCQTGAQKLFFTTLDSIFQPNNWVWTTGRGALVQATLLEDGGGTKYVWGLSGDLQGSDSTVTTGAVYISKLIGSDIDGDGSSDNPLASIGAAITLAGAPVSRTNLIIQDSETYDENLVFPNGLINLIGPTASLVPSVGDAITLSFGVASGMLINLGVIQAPGANAINCTTAAGTIVSLVDVVVGDVVTAASVTGILMNATLINSNLNAAVGTSIRYTTARRLGTNTGSIFGMSPEGTTDNWDVAGTLTASGLSYPVADGTSGQAIVTNGGGTLSFATVGGGLSFNSVAGTSQAAAVANAYICTNAAQTTVTLPGTCAVGDTVRVYGQGAAGWILAANAGQVILIGTGTTTVAGSLTSVAATDLVEVTCLVANTSWTVNYVYSAGLTIA